MLARLLQTRRQPQQRILVLIADRHDAEEARPPFRQCAGFVDDQRVDLLHRFERFGIAHQNAGMRAAAGADHDRHRRREPQRAGAGDDQHGDGVEEPKSHRRRRPENRPRGKGSDRDEHDARHEPARHLVREFLDWRARALRLGHHMDDPGEHRVAADPLGAHDKAAGRVDRCARHLVARGFLDRQRLAGDHRLVNVAVSFDHHTIDRHLLAGTHAQPVARLDHVERDVRLRPVLAHQPRLLWREIEQRADRAAGLRSRAQFEHLPEENQRGDDRRGLEIERHPAIGTAKRCRENSGDYRRNDAVKIRDAGAERDQREHVEAAVAQRGPAALKKRPAAPQHGWCCERQLQPRQGARRQYRNGMPAHRDYQQRDGERRGDP